MLGDTGVKLSVDVRKPILLWHEHLWGLKNSGHFFALR